MTARFELRNLNLNTFKQLKYENHIAYIICSIIATGVLTSDINLKLYYFSILIFFYNIGTYFQAMKYKIVLKTPNFYARSYKDFEVKIQNFTYILA